MGFPIIIGQTSYSKLIFIPDPAQSDGSGKTGLVAANLTVSHTRVGTNNQVVLTDVTSSLNDLATLTTAFNAWGLKEVSSTLAPGLYRLDIGNPVFASGAWTAIVYIMITTSSAAAIPLEFDLVVDVSGDIAAIKAKTDNLPVDPADASDIATEFAAVRAKTDTLPADPADASDITGQFTTVNSLVSAVKATTDQIRFTVANQIDSNIQYVNDIQVQGTGSGGTKWGP